MNVYDFDKTIYDGDSSIDFYFFCLKKHPKIIFCAFKQAFGVFLHMIGKADTKRMKEYFFSFLSHIKDANELVERFWQKNSLKIKKWYLDIKEDTDVVISASPEFLLRPICSEMGIAIIATKMDIQSGKIEGANCKGKEKINRFFEIYPHGIVDNFYSDSNSDSPMAELSKRAFIVEHDNVSTWVK